MVTLSTALPLLHAASTRTFFHSTVVHLAVDCVHHLEKYYTCERRPVRTISMFPRSCGTSGSHKKPAMQCQHAQKKLLGSLRLVRRTNHQGPCSMPSRAGAPSSIPTHCQRDQEREAHARSSRRDAEAASSAETGVKTHPPAQHSSNDTTACCELLLCTLLGRISHLRLATRWRFLPLS